MSPVIEELWIFTKQGHPLVEYSKEKLSDTRLIGNLSTTMFNFCLEFAGTEIKSFEMDRNKFTLITCMNKEIMMLVKSSPKAKNKTIEKMCNVIIDMFSDLYNVNDIIDWDGDLSKFDEFKQRLDLYFKMSNI